MSILDPIDQMDTFILDSWIRKPVSQRGEAIMVDGDPQIKVFTFAGQSRTESLESLWALGSDLIVFGLNFTVLAQEIFSLRASHGGEIISKVWSKAGYKNIKRAIRPTKVLREYRPMRVSDKLNVARKILTPQIEFVINDLSCYWVLHVNGLGAPIKKAQWNDDTGISELATLALDSEYCLTWSALESPEKALANKQARELKETQVKVYKHFKDAYISSSYSESFGYIRGYRRAIETLSGNTFPPTKILAKVTPTSIPVDLYAYVSARVATLEGGIYNPKTKGATSALFHEVTVTLSGSRGRILYGNRKDDLLLEKFRIEENKLWEELRNKIKGEGKLILINKNRRGIEEPSYTPSSASDNSIFVRSFVLVKDPEAYTQHVLAAGDSNKLYELIASKPEESLGNPKKVGSI